MKIRTAVTWKAAYLSRERQTIFENPDFIFWAFDLADYRERETGGAPEGVSWRDNED
jgi:hypothetical protein